MGTYIRYGCKPGADNRVELGHWLRDKSGGGLGLWDEEDQEIERAKGDRGSPDYLPLGVGQLKLSGADSEDNLYASLRILVEARTKFGLECMDVPSNVSDYIDDNELLAQLIDLPYWLNEWAEEDRLSKRWDKAKKKAMTAASKKYPSGVGMTVETWSNDRANLLFVHCEASDQPCWVSVCYDIAGNYRVAAGPATEDERCDLLCDAKGRGFIALPLMALGERSIKNGYDDVWSYLKRAWEIGLRTHPDAIMVGVYHATPASIDFGRKARQFVATTGCPIVRGNYTVKSGSTHYAHTPALTLDDAGVLQWEKLGGSRAVELVMQDKTPDKVASGLALRFFASYPALAILMEQNKD